MAQLLSDILSAGYPAPNVNVFSIIAVSGQSNVVADGASDTLTLSAGNNIILTTNATTDTVTIEVPSSPTWITPTLTGDRSTQTAPAISNNTLTLDCSIGTVFAVNLNSNITTLTFTNVPASGNAYGMTVTFTADGTARTITWGAAVKWGGGTAPTMTSTNGKVDIVVLVTYDGGTTWYANVVNQSY